MGVVLANPHMQEAEALRDKVRLAKDEEERKVIFRELDMTETKRQLAESRVVRQKFDVVIILIQTIVCHELSINNMIRSN